MKDWSYFLFVLIFSLTLLYIVQVSHYLCRQTFGGVWSSIVIDDCYGSFWSPTACDISTACKGDTAQSLDEVSLIEGVVP